jgi:Domain of unknown function (DUF1707)
MGRQGCSYQSPVPRRREQGRRRTRASDADRDRTVAASREHLAAGRLTGEEFDEHTDRSYPLRNSVSEKAFADINGLRQRMFISEQRRDTSRCCSFSMGPR